MINKNDFNWIEINNGAAKYSNIMKKFLKTNVALDEDFQRTFTGFYRIRRNKELFLSKYYSYMESLKGKDVSFKDIISKVNTFLGTIEPSFSSKMLATLNPSMPVWDQYVLANIGVSAPSQYSKTIDKCIDVYSKIVSWYESFLKTDEAKEMIELFDKQLPRYSHFTNIKKIDLMFWQKR